MINPQSCSGRASRVLPPVRQAFPKIRVVPLGVDGRDFGQAIEDAARQCRVLVVAGGDGTVQLAAAAAMRADVPLAVLPAGTFNHFARDLGMFPLSRAIAAIRAGALARVDLGEVNGGIELPDGPYAIARDGELGEPIDRLRARVLPRALRVIAPARPRH
ncbi:diacylglycerol/lipid kinase family protein [Naumannella halotolerans]|uniref:diacylglycerol/lipid kinase family protein n=1 Tax=Naumannella halotolerans TaxID=993414 RepID=UPI00370D6F05